MQKREIVLIGLGIALLFLVSRHSFQQPRSLDSQERPYFTGHQIADAAQGCMGTWTANPNGCEDINCPGGFRCGTIMRSCSFLTKLNQENLVVCMVVDAFQQQNADMLVIAAKVLVHLVNLAEALVATVAAVLANLLLMIPLSLSH